MIIWNGTKYKYYYILFKNNHHENYKAFNIIKIFREWDGEIRQRSIGLEQSAVPPYLIMKANYYEGKHDGACSVLLLAEDILPKFANLARNITKIPLAIFPLVNWNSVN